MRDKSSVHFYMIFTKGTHQSGKLQTSKCSGEISQNLYFDRLLSSKVYKISARKIQRSYASWHWRVVQNLKISCFKDDKNLVHFKPTTKKSKTFVLRLVPFVQSIKCFDLNSTSEIYFLTLNSHAKFEEKLPCGMENDTRNLGKFHQNAWKYQNWYFHEILLPKVENKWGKNLQRSYM